MRMYKVNADGTLNVIVGSLMKKAGKTRSIYKVKAKMVIDEEGMPDMRIDVTCNSGEHYSWSAAERQKFGVQDQWSNVLKPVMERYKEILGLQNATAVVTHDETTSEESNRDKFKEQNALSTETVPTGFQGPAQTKDTGEEEQEQQEQDRPNIQI